MFQPPTVTNRQEILNFSGWRIRQRTVRICDAYLAHGGKQWQTTPKNLPRMQRTRAIPVDWLRSGPCPNRPKGWIPIIIIIIILHNTLTLF